MKNEALNTAIRRFSNPIIVSALVILLVNDHLLRIRYPSALTGKIGDFAWILVFPFLVAIPFSLLIPRNARHQGTLVWASSCIFVGLFFSLVKTHPDVHSWLIEVSDAVLSLQISVVRDPTDLVALVMIVPATLIWRGHDTGDLGRRHNVRLIAIGSAALLSIANTAYVDQGIQCLDYYEGAVVATVPFYGYFESRDGGLTWAYNRGQWDDWCVYRDKPRETALGPIRFRFVPGEYIERSDDDGKTWTERHDASPLPEGSISFWNYELGQSVVFENGPFDAVVDPESENAIFAMGHKGVLIRFPEGEWTWVNVGKYGREIPDNGRPIAKVAIWLIGEFVLAIAFSIFAVATLMIQQSRIFINKILIGVAWLLWFIALLIEPARLYGSYSILFKQAVYGVGAILLFSVVGAKLSDLRRLGRRVPRRIVGFIATSTILMFLPFLLWAYNVFPDYRAAQVAAVVIGLGVIVVGSQTIRNDILAMRGETDRSGDTDVDAEEARTLP